MGRDVDTYGLGGADIAPDIHRRAAIHVADRIAAEHPTDWDETAPGYAGQVVAQDPTVRACVRDLLDALGYTRKEPA